MKKYKSKEEQSFYIAIMNDTNEVILTNKKSILSQHIGIGVDTIRDKYDKQGKYELKNCILYSNIQHAKLLKYIPQRKCLHNERDNTDKSVIKPSFPIEVQKIDEPWLF